MTVEELIQILQTKDPKSVVLRADNSGGYEAVKEVREEPATEVATRKHVIAILLA